MLAVLGFITILLVLALIMNKKVSTLVALIFVPAITGFIAAFINAPNVIIKAAQTAAEKADVSGHVAARLGLPVARDKILAGDARFGAILRVPVLFFTQPMPYFDQLARDAFRLDFSARMALARLEASAGLSPADRQWYCAVLVQYFDRAPQFMSCPPQQAYAELFRFLCRTDLLTASDVSTLLRMAGALALPAELISEMMEVRTRRFETVTGFEDLELD